jgi:hypothetical protein
MLLGGGVVWAAALPHTLLQNPRVGMRLHKQGRCVRPGGTVAVVEFFG